MEGESPVMKIARGFARNRQAPILKSYARDAKRGSILVRSPGMCNQSMSGSCGVCYSL